MTTKTKKARARKSLKASGTTIGTVADFVEWSERLERTMLACERALASQSDRDYSLALDHVESVCRDFFTDSVPETILAELERIVLDKKAGAAVEWNGLTSSTWHILAEDFCKRIHVELRRAANLEVAEITRDGLRETLAKQCRVPVGHVVIGLGYERSLIEHVPDDDRTTPKNGTGTKRGGGRRPDPEIQERNSKIANRIRLGDDNDKISQTFSVSVDTVKQVRSQLKKSGIVN